MKKLLLIALLLLGGIAAPLFAQQVNNRPLSDLDEKYIFVTIDRTALRGVRIELDYGQEERPFQ